MKRKILILSVIFSSSLIFQSCEKEDNSNQLLKHKNSPEFINSEPTITESESFGNSNYEAYVYNLANSTNKHFENETPTVGEWITHFYNEYNVNIILPNSSNNELELDSVLSRYYIDYFSSNFSTGSNTFRDYWLDQIAYNIVLNSNEKDIISNVIYITNAFGQVVSNGGNPTEYHPWEGRFNDCMRTEVPNGPFTGAAWVFSGAVFLSVGDCIGSASNWW